MLISQPSHLAFLGLGTPQETKVFEGMSMQASRIRREWPPGQWIIARLCALLISALAIPTPLMLLEQRIEEGHA